jgi:arabinose-5-phosphate isomerase
MTKNPVFINDNSLASKALSIMNEKKITSLLVKNEKSDSKKAIKLKGIIHIHDLLNYGIK